MKDENAIDRREGFPQLPLDKENKLKEGSWEDYFCFWEEEESKCVRGKTNLLCVKKCCSWKQMVCKQKNMKESYV
jgi:hypothetical protein